LYLLYVDASGTPELSDVTKAFTLLGVCVHEGTWHALDQRVRALKERYSSEPRQFELHAMDFCVSIKEQSEVDGFDDLDWSERQRRIRQLREEKLEKYQVPKRNKKAKYFKRTNRFIHLTRHERTRLFQEGLEIVGSHHGLVLFGEVVDKQHFLKAHGNASPVGDTFAQVVSRFDSYLKRTNNYLEHGVENGLLVIDREPSSEDRYRHLLARYRDHGHPWGNLQHVIETPFFVDSKLATAIQLADLCAYALRRHIEHSDCTHEKTDFRRIFHKFDRSEGNLHGVRHYCARGSCTCLVCSERGHC